jgi:hypothetical protein
MKQPVHIREAVLQSWQKAWLSIRPTLARSFLLMAKSSRAFSNQQLAELNDYNSLGTKAASPGPAVDYNFILFGLGNEIATVDTDVVIVGSGCGGAVCAKVLAEVGNRVLVVDKGYYLPPSQLPISPLESGALYEEGLVTADSATTIFTANCWGGGGTINWSVSLQTPESVRQEWTSKGLGFFTSKDYQESLDRVCDFMGLSADHIQHNHRNTVLLGGVQKLGWEARVCPQNKAGAKHYRGHCGYGCRSGEKQGPAVSWLPAALKPGSQFIEGFKVSEITFDGSQSNRATGIRCTWTSRDPSGSIPSPGCQRIYSQVQVTA